MKKQILHLIAFIGIISAANAQTTIPNGDFENWTNATQNTAQPTDWHSNKTGGGFASFGPQTCFQDTTAYSGTYCVRMVTGSALGTVVNSSCATGVIVAPTTMKADGFIADTGVARNAFTGRPDSIVFWYKFSPSGTDSPDVQVRLHVGNAYSPETPSNSNHPDSTVNIIGRARWDGPSVSQPVWQRVSMPMVYVDGRTPEYIFITMTGSGDQLGGTPGTTFWVDDMQAIYNPATGIQDLTAPQAKVWWSGSNDLAIDLLNQNLTGASLQLMNMSGQIVLDQPLASQNTNTIHITCASGVYVYRIVSAERTMTGRIVRE